MISRLRQLLFFLLQSAIGSRAGRYYREYLDLEGKNAGELSALQERRLKRLMHHALTSIPYYQERVVPAKDLKLSDFPVLTKSDIREHYTSLMASDLREEYTSGKKHQLRYSWSEVKTGGSTGIPTTVIHDRDFRDRGRASRLYSQYLCGFPFGTPYFRLWGSMKEINEMTMSLPQRAMSYLAGETLLNAFKMSTDEMDRYVRTMSESSVAHLMAYADAVHAVAKRVLRERRAVRPFESIMLCAGTVTPDMREDIRQAFQARVHNKYGTRECGDIACECERGGFHLYSNHAYVEIVERDGTPAAPGKRGRILVTLLGNYSFPIIRYDIGDVGAFADSACGCGRPFPLMKSIEGRDVDFLVSSAGDYVSPVYIRHLLGVVHNPGFFKRFQLVQKSRAECDLKLELENGVSPSQVSETVDLILRDLKQVLGSGCTITVHYPPLIEESESGKFAYTINHSVKSS